MNKEIEYGVKISNSQEVKEFLQSNSLFEKVTNISRDIYKNGGKYFVKVSNETEEEKTQAVFSVKEDLIGQGIEDGMKVAEELDIEVSSEQLNKLTKMLTMFGFKQTSHFFKKRYQYEIDGLMVTVDEYDSATNLEIEGPDEKTVMSVVDKIPFTPFEEN